MPETTSSVYKTVSWLLAILLVGSVALLLSFSENRSEVLAAKDAQISQSTQLIKAAAQELEQSKAASNRLGAEAQALMGKLEAADRAQQELQADMEALKEQHAQSLAAEQENASRKYAELKEQRDAANERVAALDASVAQVEQEMRDAAAAHDAQTLQLESQMKGEVDFYRTALEGSDPERAAQLVGLELQLQETRQSLEQAQQTMQAIQEEAAQLDEQLTGANRVVAERDQSLLEIGQALETLRSDLAREQSAHTALQQIHEATVTQNADARAKLQASFDAAKAAHATKMNEAKGKISDLNTKLQAETAALAALQEKHSAMVTELRGSLDAAETTLAGVRAELTAAVDRATQAQQTHEQQIAEARSTTARLEQTLEQTQQKAARDLAASRQEGEQAVAHVRGVYREFSKLGGQHTDQGMLLSLAEDDLRFRISQAQLPDGDLPGLDQIAELLARYPKLAARIEGHTDSKGRDETNLELSQKRADAVKQALVERGVDPQRMATEGIGAVRPIADNANSSGRRKNRRVEIYVLEN